MTDHDKASGQSGHQEPKRKTVACALCGTHVDVEQITTVHGRFFCSDCAAGAAALEEFKPFREKYDMRSIRWAVVGCFVLLVVVVFGITFTMIYSYFRLGRLGDCKARMDVLHKAILEYASVYNAYPPENNNLMPLYGKRFTTNFKLFVCPGTTNTVTTVHHLKDDGDSPTGPGMSYFYQGGHRFFLAEGDEARPLFWDQSPANHKGRGVNVIYKDGHHEYWKASEPKLVDPAQAGASPGEHAPS
jgi:hypothetical protein